MIPQDVSPNSLRSKQVEARKIDNNSAHVALQRRTAAANRRF